MEPSRYQAVRRLWRSGELPIRVRMNVGAVTRGAEADEVRAWQTYLAPGLGDDMLSVLGLGEVVHYGCHDWEGMTPLHISDHDHDQLAATLLDVARGGWPLTLHAILDTSVTRILDAVETVAAQVPLEPLRWSLCHVECIGAANLRRLRDLGSGSRCRAGWCTRPRSAPTAGGPTSCGTRRRSATSSRWASRSAAAPTPPAAPPTTRGRRCGGS
ncbi:hypothetical protein BJF78_11505 [Pseudonocardia sp. CNS-139]|nr:hypothetical protein BJF78_11505 [Pseudonocardia sp. CNS-139]